MSTAEDVLSWQTCRGPSVSPLNNLTQVWTPKNVRVTAIFILFSLILQNT